MTEYLTSSKAKLESKGVKSIKSRVVNLNTFSPNLTCYIMKQYLISALEQIYGLTCEFLSEIKNTETKELIQLYSSWQYLYGTPIPCTFICENRFDWGNIQLRFVIKNGIIETLQVFTDALDHSLPSRLKSALEQHKFAMEEIEICLQANFETDLANNLLHVITKDAAF